MEFTFLPHSSTRQHRRYHYKPVDRKKGKSISLEPLEKTKNLALEPLGNLKNILLEPRPEKPTEPQEPSPELVAKVSLHFDASYIQIYYEPMLMKMILGHVHDFCDRCNIECASQRLYKLSKQTECIFPRNGHKLELIFKNWCNPSISVRVGTFEKECQCLSNAAFRNDFVLQKQPQELMDLLEKIFTRANPKKITHIRLGGKATEAARDHLLVLTHDLLLFVEDKFPNVKSLSLEGVVLHDSVVENRTFLKRLFVFSVAKTPLKFFRKITELCLDRFSCESRDNLKSAMKQLIGKNLQYFTLNTFGMGHQGYAFLEHMNTLRHKVKTLDLHLDEDAFGANVSPESRAPEVIAQFLSDCMNFAENFRLHFWQDDRLSDSPQLFKLMTAISRMPSVVHISVLDLDIIARHPPQVVALSQILGTLKNLPCLRELASGGYRPRKATEGEVKLYIDSLTQALKCSPHLHKLRLANFPREFVTETMLSIIFTSIPQGVTSLSLESIRRLNNLKHLDLTQMSRQTGSFLRHFLMRESLLRSFGCDIVCLAPAVTLMRNFSMHPFLSRIRIGFQSLNEDATIKLLSQYYEKVNIERWRIHPYKNFRTAYMLFCEHRRFDAPPTPLNDLRALTDDDVNAPRFRERRNNARFYHRSLCEVSYGPSDSIAREFDVDFAEG